MRDDSAAASGRRPGAGHGPAASPLRAPETPDTQGPRADIFAKQIGTTVPEISEAEAQIDGARRDARPDPTRTKQLCQDGGEPGAGSRVVLSPAVRTGTQP